MPVHQAKALANDEHIAVLSPSLQALALRGTVRTYKKNTIVLSEGDPGDTFFIILCGSARAFSSDQSGREITYGLIHTGDYFGEMSLDGGCRSASVMTMNQTTCAVITGAAVRDHLVDEPGFALDLIAKVIRRARLANETARNMALLDVYGRVVAVLESEQGPGHADAHVVISPITHQNIASRVGASREMVSRLLKDLEKGDYIELGIKRIVLKRKLPARW